MKKITSNLCIAILLLFIGQQLNAQTCDPVGDFTQDFENTPANVGDVPVCWGSIVDAISTANASVGVVSYGGNEAPNVISLSSGSDVGAKLYLITPELMDLSAGDHVLHFFAHTGNPADLQVGTITDPSDASTFTPIESMALPYSYQEFTVYFNQAYTDQYIAFKATYPSYAYDTTYIDDVTWEALPSCPKPIDLSVSNLTTTSAETSWTEIGDATQWDIIYGETGFDPTTEGTTVSDTDGTLGKTISGLSSATTYDFYVKAVCGAGDESVLSDPYTFTTVCDPVGDFIQGFEDTPLTEVPLCWSSLVPTVPSGVYVTIGVVGSYAANSGSHAFEISNSDGTIGELYLITPSLLDLSSGDHELRFFAASYGGNLEVGTMTDPTDASTFTLVQTATLATDNSYQEYTVVFDGTYTDQYIALRTPNSTGYHDVLIDDVFWEPIPACAKPTDLTATNVATTSADVSWTENGGSTAWEIIYGETGFDPVTEGTTVSDTDGTLGETLSGLSPATNYDFYVKASCDGGGESLLAGPYPFLTTCAPIGDFTENFDTTASGELPICWNKLLNTTDAYAGVIVSSYGAYSDPNLLDMYNTTVGAELYLITPELNNLADADHQLHFYAQLNSNTLEIGTMTDPTDASTFTSIQTLPTSTDSDYHEYTVYFDQAYTDQYIAFKATFSVAYSTINIDDVAWEPIPSCPKPAYLTTSNITANSADVSWTENGSATEWEIIYGAPGFDPASEGTTVSDNDGTLGETLSGLSSNTAYEYYVKSICGVGDESLLAGPSTFTTACDPFGDFTEDFESTVVGEVPDCWNRIINASSTAYASVGVASYGGNAAPNTVQMYNGYDAATQLYLITPSLIDLSSGDHQLRFSANTTTYSANAANVEVGTMTDPFDESTFTPIETETLTTTYQEFTIYFNQPYTDQYIAFRATASTLYTSVDIDDVVWEPLPSCPPPTDLTADNITTTSADVSWTENGSATEWEIIYGAPGFDPETEGTTLSDHDGTLGETITGLDPGPNYEFYVKAICGTDDESDLVGPSPFQTTCDPIGDFTQNFDTTASGGLPICWNKLLNTTDTYAGVLVYTYGAYSDPNTLYMNNSSDINAELYLITPELNNLADADHQLNFYAQLNSNTLEIGTMTDPMDASTFTSIQTLPTSSDSDYHEYTVYFDQAYTDQYIAFKATFSAAYSSQSIDDVAWEPIPSCLKPAYLTASNITTNSADVSWTENGSATEWEIIYGETGFDPASEGTTVSDTDGTLGETLSGLSSNTVYEYYVKSICGVGDESLLTGPSTFTTLCGPFGDFTEDFNDTPDQQLPNCWTNLINSVPGSGAYAYVYYDDQLDMTGYSDANAVVYAITPELTALPDGDHQLRFFANNSGGGSLEVGTMTDPTDESTYTAVETIPISNNVQEYTVLFDQAYTDQYIAFKTTYLSTYTYVYIDDVIWEPIPTGYVYVNDTDGWLPSDPNGSATASDNITVMNGTASFTGAIAVNDITVMSGATLNVEDVLTINGNITNNGDMVFKSTATSDGELAEVPSGSTITGNVTVERYMSANRSYRFVSSAVTTSGSIHDNWQEGASSATDDPNPGFGTHITGSLETDADHHGFDVTISGNPSLFRLNVDTQAFDAVGNTDMNTLTAGDDYLLFVRGSRAIDLTADPAPTADETVLRATGTLEIGSVTKTFTNSTGQIVPVANPYQSAVDLYDLFGTSSAATNINSNAVYVYDPSLAGGEGAYATVNMVDGTTDSGSANEFLQPGQAVQVATTGANAEIVFEEAYKDPGMHTATFGVENNAHINGHLFTAANYASDETPHDGFSILFNQSFDNALNAMDAVKPMNFKENMGIGTPSQAYSIERRELPIENEDIALFNTNYENQEYALVLEVSKFEGTTPYLVDTYTGEQTELQAGENVIGFSVDQNVAGSIVSNRFYIHFGPSTLSVGGQQADYGIQLYPNPTESGAAFYVTAGQFEGQNVSVSITDLLGKTVYTTTKQFNAGKIAIQPESPLGSGVYFVRIAQDGKTVNKRLVVK